MWSFLPGTVHPNTMGKNGFRVQINVAKLFYCLKQRLLCQEQNLSLHVINNHSSSTSYPPPQLVASVPAHVSGPLVSQMAWSICLFLERF